MFRVESLARIEQLSLQFPILIRSEFAVNAFERVVNNLAELQHALPDALDASPTACALLFEMPVTLGELLECLYHDTAAHFASRFHRSHPNFAKIVAFGDLATRYILIRLAAGDIRPEYFMLLRELTGEHPYPERTGFDDRDRIDWLFWAKENGKLESLALDLLAQSGTML
jgi:hypothetical protein